MLLFSVPVPLAMRQPEALAHSYAAAARAAQGVLTLPVPFLALPKILDLALMYPVITLEARCCVPMCMLALRIFPHAHALTVPTAPRGAGAGCKRRADAFGGVDA